MTYHINAIGIPKAQPRIKAYRRGAHAGVYTPDTADDWKRSVMIAAHELAGIMLNGELALTVEFYLPAPKRKCGEYVQTKPDLDNLEKAVMDALTSIGVWVDDSRVVEKHSSKRYAKTREPGASITIKDAV